MASTNYDAALAKVLSYEGGFSNHRDDPGGPTNHGITKAVYEEFVGRAVTVAEIKAMPLEHAKEIFRRKYWGRVNGDALRVGEDLATFDAAVNSGVSRGLKWLADAQSSDAVTTVKRLCAARLSFLHALRTYSVFGRGWTRRVADVEATGVKMALEAAGKSADEVRRHLDEEAHDADIKAADKTTKGTIGTAVATALNGTVAHSTGYNEIGLIVGGLVIAAVVVYAVWHTLHHSHRAAAYIAAAQE